MLGFITGPREEIRSSSNGNVNKNRVRRVAYLSTHPLKSEVRYGKFQAAPAKNRTFFVGQLPELSSGRRGVKMF